MMNCCNCYRTDGKRNDCYYHIPAMAAYSNERVAAIVVSVLYRMLTNNYNVIMYMKKIIYQMLVGCYIVAALVLACACNSQLDIQTRYPFTVETMPVPKKLKVNETAEIRCELKRDGRWEDTRYTIRWFLYDGKGTLKLDDGTVLLPNDRYPLEKETFRLYFTSQSDEQSSLKVWVEDSFGQTVELEFSYNNENEKEK